VYLWLKGKKTKTGKEMIDKEVGSLASSARSGKAKIDKKMSKAGVDYKTVGGAIITIIGIVLIVFNISAVLMAVVGFVLVYFGLKLLGYTIKI